MWVDVHPLMLQKWLVLAFHDCNITSKIISLYKYKFVWPMILEVSAHSQINSLPWSLYQGSTSGGNHTGGGTAKLKAERKQRASLGCSTAPHGCVPVWQRSFSHNSWQRLVPWNKALINTGALRDPFPSDLPTQGFLVNYWLQGPDRIRSYKLSINFASTRVAFSIVRFLPCVFGSKCRVYNYPLCLKLYYLKMME